MSEEKANTTKSEGEVSANPKALIRKTLFYFNGVVPQQIRREFREGNIGPTSETIKHVPSHITNPDGSIAVGIYPHKSNADGNTPDDSISLPSGPFVVFSAPPTGPTNDTWHLKRKRIFFSLIVAYFSLITYFFFKSLHFDGETAAKSESLFLLLSYVTEILVSVLGIVGVKTENIRYLTYYMIALILDFFIGVMKVTSIIALVQYTVELALCVIANSIRSRLMYRWYSSSLR